MLLVFCTRGGVFAESIFSDFWQQIKESDKIISAGLVFPQINETVKVGDYSFHTEDNGFGLDGQFRMVLPKNFALMADADISLLNDEDAHTFSFVLGAGYNFNFGIERLKLIASGVMGFESGDGEKDIGSVYYDGRNCKAKLDYGTGNFIFGVDLYANFRLGKKFGLFAQCDVLFGVGSCEGDVKAVTDKDYSGDITKTVGSESGSSQTFMFKPKFGMCWTL